MLSRRRRPRPRTRIIQVDGGVYLITSRAARRLETQRLDPKETSLALRMLDDCQAEVEAIVLGGRQRS